METHDPLCPWFGSGDPWASGSSVHTCACDLIAKVRADERERNAAEVEATAKWCREDERFTLRAQVEALPSVMDGNVELVVLASVRAMLDGATDESE